MGATTNGFLSSLLDLIFPRRCAGCGRRDTWLCSECQRQLPVLSAPFCRYCGKPTTGVQTCPECWRRRPALDGVRSAYYFEGPIRTLIHRFKYRRQRDLAAALAILLRGPITALLPVDCIVPVPLHPSRERQRGYNQATLLAIELGALLGLPVVDNCVQRIKDTPAQMSLPAAQRRRNVRGAFVCHDRRIASLSILLLDDVCTTGATLGACAEGLKRGGARSVRGLTLARAR